MIKIDMHCHSCYSDGTDSAAQLARMAKRRGLSVVSMTDHDTIDGVKPFLSECAKISVKALTGVEISAEYPRTMHILGYCFDVNHVELNEKLSKLQVYREERNVRMLESLREVGVDISMEDVKAEAGTGVIGRPHFAKAMVRKGLVGDTSTAFYRYLGRGAAAYIPKTRLCPGEVIHLIRRAGGLPVLAHPIQTSNDLKELVEILRELKSMGLWGLECYSGHHDSSLVQSYLKLAHELRLESTGGSDYHGGNRIGRNMGVVVPESLLPWARLGIHL